MTQSRSREESKPDSIPTRASLLGRLKNWDDQESWDDFALTYSRLIRGFAIQSGLTETEAGDVEQETLLCVAKTIHQFESDPEKGTFKAWLLKLTRWRIADQFRKRPPESSDRRASLRDSDETPTVEKIPDDPKLDAFWDAEWRKNILETAIARAGRKANPKHYQIFDLYAVRKWPAIKVAKAMGVSVVQVYLVNHRLIKQVRQEAEYLESKLD